MLTENRTDENKKFLSSLRAGDLFYAELAPFSDKRFDPLLHVLCIKRVLQDTRQVLLTVLAQEQEQRDGGLGGFPLFWKIVPLNTLVSCALCLRMESLDALPLYINYKFRSREYTHLLSGGKIADVLDVHDGRSRDDTLESCSQQSLHGRETHA